MRRRIHPAYPTTSQILPLITIGNNNVPTGDNKPKGNKINIVLFSASILITLILLSGAIITTFIGGGSYTTLFDEGGDDITIGPMSSYEVELDSGMTFELEISSTDEVDIMIVERQDDPFDEDTIVSWNDVTDTTVEQDIPHNVQYILVFKNTNLVPVDVEYQYTYFDEEEISGMFSYPFYCLSLLFLVFIVVDLLLLIKVYIDRKVSR